MKSLRHYWNAIRTRLMSPEEYARFIGVKVGIGCTIDTKKWSTAPYLIEIGNYVRIAKGTSYYTHGGLVSLRKLYNDNDIDQFGKIKVGDYSYIGENCMIMQGVTIGERCIIGGGAWCLKVFPMAVWLQGTLPNSLATQKISIRGLKQQMMFIALACHWPRRKSICSRFPIVASLKNLLSKYQNGNLYGREALNVAASKRQAFEAS